MVTTSFTDYSEDEGYLVLSQGQVVFVEYVGDEESQEVGWLYGYKSGLNGSKCHGWFPQYVVPPVERYEDSENKALESPSGRIPRVVGPRTATPPPEETELHGAITPPPSDEEDVCPGVAAPAPGASWLALPEPSPAADPASDPPTPAGQPLAAQLPEPGFDSPHGSADWSDLRAVLQGLDVGKNLPMYKFRQELQEKVLKNRVVFVDADTGSGKSTLVPLCLAEQCMQEGRSCRIVVTQPRRVAAKGLAQRVAQQVGQDVGELIGYRMGGHEKKDNPSKGSVVYVTVGHFLEAIVHNPTHLDSYSHIVLDEVHERFVEADFLMALLRLNLSRPETWHQRIIVMSATLQKALYAFFRPTMLPSPHLAEMVSVTSPGSTPFRVEDIYLDSELLRRYHPGVIDNAPPFGPLMPSSLVSDKPQVSSDRLTMACKNLTKTGARLLRSLYEVHHIHVVLAFLPGLDQIQELKKLLDKEADSMHELHKFKQQRDPNIGPFNWPDIILMHSALDKTDYERALEPSDPGVWKVVLATNVAESSVTVPDVGAVVDFAMHRTNKYDDEKKMSMLLTTWCSKASLKQRRGRTGRTCDGRYYCMVERRLYEALQDFDDSGVERSSLTKVALEGAYLAERLNKPPLIRSRLPALLRGHENEHFVHFFDGVAGMWQVEDKVTGVVSWAPEEDLMLNELKLDHILELLPSPPGMSRVNTAVRDLQDLGTLTLDERPTALGIACLKLPTEVVLARLVVIGWAMGMSESACILAAALSLTPSCDVLRTPVNTRDELKDEDLKRLKNTVDARSKADRGYLSEPILLHTLCLEWLKARRGDQTAGEKLGGVPTLQSVEKDIIHQRLWTQFSNKVVDLWRSLARLSPREEEQSRLRVLQEVAQGKWRPDWESYLESDPEKLLALLTFGLAPGTFVAVGQSPSLYGKGTYGEFWKMAQQSEWKPSDCLYWKHEQTEVRQVLRHLESGRRGSLQHMSEDDIKELQNDSYLQDEENKHPCMLHLDETALPPQRLALHDERQRLQAPQERLLPLEFEFLYRLCSPFNGKANIDNLKVKSCPQHPCAMNWYMPMPSNEGDRLIEVCLNWKSPAYSLLSGQTRPGRDANSRCRPKRFLVACGGDYRTDYHGDTPTRVTVLRGVSVLPAKHRGRQALLWLLASGIPKDAKMTALCAPTAGLEPGRFEIRGVWMWERTFRLSNDAILSAEDLRAVNRFREALKQLQSYQTHAWAGDWMDQFRTAVRIDCLGEYLRVSDQSVQDAKTFYYRSVDGAWVAAEEGQEMLVELSEGQLQWGERMLTRTEEDLAIFKQFNPSSVQAFHQAARDFLQVASAEPQRRGPWPGRFVPLCADGPLSAFNLERIDGLLEPFRERLQEMPQLSGFVSEEEEEEEDDEADDDEEPYMDKSLENVDKDLMWRLAEEEDFKPDDCRFIILPENSLALPTAATCTRCQEEGKNFSRKQLGRPIYLRLCTDCVALAHAEHQGSVYRKADKTIMRSGAGPMPPPPTLVPAAQGKKVCSVCQVELTPLNSTETQRKRPVSKRKCEACNAKPEQRTTDPIEQFQ